MIGRPGTAADMFQAIANAGINLQMISMSEIKVSCVIADDRASDAALQLGQLFRVIPQNHRPSSTNASLKPVRGIALDQKQSRLAILQVPDCPGTAAKVFRHLAKAGVVVDTIIQSQRGTLNGAGIPTNDIAFTVPRDQADTAEKVLLEIAPELTSAGIAVTHDIAKVSIVGAEMEAYPGIAARMFQALAEEGINIEMIATSEIKVSCVVPRHYGIQALQTIHRVFELDRT
jgi:aspartate kinase